MPKSSPVSDREVAPAPGERPPREPRVASRSHEAVQPGSRRRFTPADKLRLVKAAEAAIASGERGALEALLRKEGIYSSHLSAWREQLGTRGAAGLAPQKPGRKPKLDEKDKQLVAMTKELAKVTYKLRVAHALIDLQKKAHEVLGIALPEFDEESL